MVTAPLVLLLVFGALEVHGQLLQSNSIHRTPAAEKPINDLWCYRCHTMDHKDRCADFRINHTSFMSKCKDDRKYCMVKRFSYTTSNENSTSLLKMWSLERNCTSKCDPGCIVIGERTKLYACTSCCQTTLCNNGTGRGEALLSCDLLPSVMAIVAVFGPRGLVSLLASIAGGVLSR